MPRLPLSTLIRQFACVQTQIRLNEIKNTSSMQVRPEDTLINTAIHFVGGESCISWKKDEGQYDTPADILWATGAAYSFVRLRIRKSGDWMPDFSHIKKKSICVGVYVPGDIGWYASHNPSFYHVGGATLNAESPRKTFLNFRNSY